MILENTSCSELRAVADKYKELESKVQHRIVFCAGTGCIANGALGVHDALVEKIAERGINALTELKKESLSVSADNTHVSQSGCRGFCQMGPLITIYPADILYVKVKPEDVDEIVEKP